MIKKVICILHVGGQMRLKCEFKKKNSIDPKTEPCGTPIRNHIKLMQYNLV